MKTVGESRTGPVVGLECSYGVYFPAAQAASVLGDIAQIAYSPAAHRTNLILPDGNRVTVPFRSWFGHGETISLPPFSRVRLDVWLRFPPAVENDGPWGFDRDSGMAPEPEQSGPVPIRLWVYMGTHHTGLVFFPPGPQTGRLFVQSASIRQFLSQLLERHQGILGALDDIDNGKAYLLPDLRTCIDLPDLQDYYDANHGIDVDGWLDELLKQRPLPALPPIAEPIREHQDDLTDETLKALETILGSSREIVPPRYHRTFEERPFDACDFCAQPVLIPGTRYTVTKVYAGGELSQELAICSDCGNTLRESYSAESLEASAQIFAAVPVHRRALIAADESIDRVEQLTGSCLLCDAPKDETELHVEYALCEANEIVYSFYPMTVCEGCMVRIYDVLSEKTKEAGRRFYDDHFGFPPPGSPSLQRQPDTLPVWISF